MRHGNLELEDRRKEMSELAWVDRVDKSGLNAQGLSGGELGYLLYLEGLARELAHLLQNRRKEMGLEVVDYVDVALVQDCCDQLTTATLVFSRYLREKVRIRRFSPKPLADADCQSHGFTCSLGRAYQFQTYLRRVAS